MQTYFMDVPIYNLQAVGRAEAEKMRMKASAYKQYGDAAVMALVLEALPQVKQHCSQIVPKVWALPNPRLLLLSDPTLYLPCQRCKLSSQTFFVFLVQP